MQSYSNKEITKVTLVLILCLITFSTIVCVTTCSTPIYTSWLHCMTLWLFTSRGTSRSILCLKCCTTFLKSLETLHIDTPAFH